MFFFSVSDTGILGLKVKNLSAPNRNRTLKLTNNIYKKCFAKNCFVNNFHVKLPLKVLSNMEEKLQTVMISQKIINTIIIEICYFPPEVVKSQQTNKLCRAHTFGFCGMMLMRLSASFLDSLNMPNLAYTADRQPRIPSSSGESIKASE